MAKKKICSSCETKLDDDNLTYAYDGREICTSCENDDIIESVLQIKPIGNIEDYPDFEKLEYSYLLEEDRSAYLTVGHLHNWTEGIFYFSSKSIDGWRSYAVPRSDTYTEIYENCTSDEYHNQEVKKIIDMIIDHCLQKGIRAVRVVSRTSNIFSVGVAIWVHNEDLEKFTLRLEGEINL